MFITKNLHFVKIFQKSFKTDHLSLPLDLDFVVISSKSKSELLNTAKHKSSSKGGKIGRKCAKCAPTPCRRSKRLEKKLMKNYVEMLSVSTKRLPNPPITPPTATPCGSLGSSNLKELNSNNNQNNYNNNNPSSSAFNNGNNVTPTSPTATTSIPSNSNMANNLSMFGACSNSIPDFDVSMDKSSNCTVVGSSNGSSNGSSSSSSSSSASSSSSSGLQNSAPKEKEFVFTGNPHFLKILLCLKYFMFITLYMFIYNIVNPFHLCGLFVWMVKRTSRELGNSYVYDWRVSERMSLFDSSWLQIMLHLYYFTKFSMQPSSSSSTRIKIIATFYHNNFISLKTIIEFPSSKLYSKFRFHFLTGQSTCWIVNIS